MSFKFHVLILLILTFFECIYSLKYITIPFTVQKFSHTDDKKGLLRDFLYKDILVELSFGNPKQKIPLSAGMGEYSTFIISKEADDFEGAKFDQSLSTSYYTPYYLNEMYSFQIFNEAYPSKDSFHIDSPEVEIKNYEFFLVTKLGKNICYLPFCEVLTQPGIIGFKMAQSETYTEIVNNTNLIMQLKEKEIIDNYDFNFFFESDDKGYIIIGQKPHEYDSDHFKLENYIFTKTVNENSKELDWYLKFDKIYFGNEKLSTDKNILLRIEYGVINGIKDWQQIFEKNFFGELIKEKKCFLGKGWNDGYSYFHYYCDKNINLTKFEPVKFIINDLNYEIILTKDDLFIEENNKLFFLIIFGHPQPILGFPLFKKYQLIFNQDTKTIGLYNNINGNPTVPIPPTIYSKEEKKKPDSNKLIVFLLLIVIIMFSIYMVRRLLKFKRKNDLNNASIEYKLKASDIQLVDYEKIDK